VSVVWRGGGALKALWSGSASGTRLTGSIGRVVAVMFFLFTAAPAAHASFGDCAHPGYLAQFDERLESIPHDCVETLRVDVATASGTRQIRLIHDRNAGWALLPGVLEEFQRGIRAAAQALRQIGSYEIDDTTVLLIDGLTPREESSESFSDIAASTSFSDHECHISAYLLSAGGTTSYAAYVVAHEIFHCVQGATLTPAQVDTSSGGVGSGGDWWLEGTAEWFAALSLPEVTTLQRWIARFDGRSSDTPLYEMAYEAVVFFLWLNDAEGPSSIIPVLHQMANRPHASSQRAAMASALDGDSWLAFAQRYIDGDIKHPHGTPISVNASDGDNWRYTETGTNRITLPPFVLRRGWVEFDCGKWAADAQPAEGRAFRSDGGTWGELPGRIDTRNGDESRYRFVGLAASRSDVVLQVRGEQEAACEPCGGSTAVDACLVGAWRQTGGGPIEWMRKVMDGIAIPEGERHNVLDVFQADGTYFTAPLTAKITSIAETDRATLRGDAQVVAQTSGRWSGENGRLNLCQDQLRSSGTVRATSSDGMDETFPVPVTAAPDLVTLEFTCTDSTLETRLPIPGVPEPIVTQYSRVGDRLVE